MLHIENPLLTKACQPYTSYLALGREGKINKRLRLHPFAIHFPTTGRDSVSIPIPPRWRDPLDPPAAASALWRVWASQTQTSSQPGARPHLLNSQLVKSFKNGIEKRGR